MMDANTAQLAGLEHAEQLKRLYTEDVMSNLDLWDRLARTDPKHTKSFTRAGGFKGTAIKPMWAIKKATEEFGPIGKGWGWCEDSREFVRLEDGQVLVYVQVRVWYMLDGSPYWTGPQWGGDFAVKKNKHGIQPDDEALKKALTDAVTKCLSYIGIGADVHMGQFDDSKYVEALSKEYAEKEAEPIPDAIRKRLEKAAQGGTDALKKEWEDIGQSMRHVVAQHVSWWEELKAKAAEVDEQEKAA